MPTKTSARTVPEYLRGLDPERRAILSAVRNVVNQHLPEGYAEGIAFGMIGWFVPLETFPDTYNGHPLCYAGLAANKNFNTLYLMGPYGDPRQRQFLEEEFKQRGLKLDMGKSCIHFKTLDDLPLDVIATVIQWTPASAMMAAHEASHGKKASGGKKAARAR
jgi:hypothetical protein